MRTENADLIQAASTRDLYSLQCLIVDGQNEILQSWLAPSQEVFHTQLRLNMQKSARARRRLIRPEDEIPYHLGVWDGWLQAFHALDDAQSRENDIISMAVEKSPKTEEIIRFLYQNDHALCHKELADALGMSYSALSNAMKRVIASGAVSVSRTGRNTRYTLTPAARRYCRQKAKWEWEDPGKKQQVTELIGSLEQLADRLKKQLSERPVPAEEQRVSAGDCLRLYVKDKLSSPKYASQIITMGPEKVLCLDEPSLDNESHQASGSHSGVHASDILQYASIRSSATRYPSVFLHRARDTNDIDDADSEVFPPADGLYFSFPLQPQAVFPSHTQYLPWYNRRSPSPTAKPLRSNEHE